MDDYVHMRCLYCGKELALFKRLRGGEFCSDGHRQRYQEEYTQLALNRLLHANPPPEQESAPLAPTTANNPQPVEAAVLQGAPAQTEMPSQTAVLDPLPAPAAAPLPVFAAQTLPVEEPAPADMSTFLVEFPVPVVFEAAAHADPATSVTPTPGLSLPHLQEFPPETTEIHLDLAGRLPLCWLRIADFQTPLQERGLELREFVRGVPKVEIRLRPAGQTGLEPEREALEVHFLDALPPEESPHLWQASEKDIPALECTAEILLGELARLDFAVTGWQEGAADSVSSEPDTEQSSSAQPPPASDVPLVIESARLEPMRVGPIRPDPAPRPSSRPEPLHFEPVHIDPVFMEQVAGTAEFDAQKNEAAAREKTASEPAPVTPPETAPVVEQAAPPPAEEPAASTQAPPTPAAITKPQPVALHGLAPSRGKPVQVFTSAVSHNSDVQVPRESRLPLRPTIVFGPALKPAEAPASVPASNIEKPPASKPMKSIPVPERRESRSTEIKPRRSEVRILPQHAKAPRPQPEPVKPEQIVPEKIVSEKIVAEQVVPEQIRQEKVRLETASRPLVKQAPAAASKETASSKETPPREKPAAKSAPAAPPVTPAEEPDLLGLPKLSFQSSESFWSRLPLVVRIGAIAAIVALMVGGVVLTSRGSAAPKVAPQAESETQMVEGPALANTAGWMQDWFFDNAGSRQGRQVDILRGSLTLRDYRLVFEGQIEQGALGWVFRAYDKSFYVEKIQVVTPGRDPEVALVRFAVIDGWEQPRTQIPLPIHAHLDTAYKVRMDVVGNRFTTWVQDQKVDQWTDGQIAAGGVGLYYDNGDSAKLRDTLNVIPLKPR